MCLEHSCTIITEAGTNILLLYENHKTSYIIHEIKAQFFFSFKKYFNNATCVVICKVTYIFKSPNRIKSKEKGEGTNFFVLMGSVLSDVMFGNCELFLKHIFWRTQLLKT